MKKEEGEGGGLKEKWGGDDLNKKWKGGGELNKRENEWEGGASSKSLWVVLFTAVSVLWLKLIFVKGRRDWII